MTLTADEFIRRSCYTCCPMASSTFAVTPCWQSPPDSQACHLPPATRRRRPRARNIQRNETTVTVYQRLTGRSLRDCPSAAKATWFCIETFLPGALPRAPPRTHHVL